MQLAKEVLGGKYEFILTTHIDKDHVHNHLIFNTVSFADHKHYHSNKRSYHYIRRTSDHICKEHVLSVIVPGPNKCKSYIEHQAARNGTSYKAKLKVRIDQLLPGCKDFDELLARLQREGYEIKRGKYISYRAPGQERFTRLKRLGIDYTEEALIARIAGHPRPSRQPKQHGGKISLLIDIQNNIKAQQSAGYKRWATIENLKRFAETSNFLTEHGISSYEELSQRYYAAILSLFISDFRAILKNECDLTILADDGFLHHHRPNGIIPLNHSVRYFESPYEQCDWLMLISPSGDAGFQIYEVEARHNDAGAVMFKLHGVEKRSE